MSKITKQDTNGVKPLLGIGELGYDNYPAGGDAGRVWVGTGTENIALAKKTEVLAVESKVAKVTSTDNAIVRFNGTAGEVQDSGVIINDSGNVMIGTTTDNVGLLIFFLPFDFCCYYTWFQINII